MRFMCCTLRFLYGLAVSWPVFEYLFRQGPVDAALRLGVVALARRLVDAFGPGAVLGVCAQGRIQRHDELLAADAHQEALQLWPHRAVAGMHGGAMEAEGHFVVA